MRSLPALLTTSTTLLFLLSCGDSASPGTDEVGDTGTASDTGSGTESGTESGTDGECMIGAEGCPCTGGGACDPGLVCMANVCVPDGSTSTTNSTTDDTTDSTTADTTDDTTDSTTGDPPPNCGDGTVDVVDGEQCDDGNTTDDDGCSSFCEVEVTADCGDDVLDPDTFEECDDGNLADGDGCSSNCQLELLGASCGDAAIDNLEVCDDNNVANGDACNPTCNLENTTTLFAGAPGVPGLADGVGGNARFGDWLVAAVDNDYLWIGDTLPNAHAVVRRIDVSTATVLTIAGGPPGDLDSNIGANARFGRIEAIATDGNTLWIADETNHEIKAVDLQPPYAVTTVAGSGVAVLSDGNGTAAGLNGVRGVIYYAGIIYFLDGGQAVLRSFDPVSGDVVTIAGSPGQFGQVDGIGNQARFISPRYMASNNSGMLFIADTNGFKIRTFNTFDSFVGTFAGDGTTGYVDGIGDLARIHRPRGMTSDGTSIYFSEFNQHTVRQGVIATGSITTNIGQHCNGAMVCAGGYQEGTGTANTQLNLPNGLAFHYPSNTLFVCDTGNSVIRALK